MVQILAGEPSSEEIEMDVVGELPESQGFNANLVLTYWFTKVEYYIVAKTAWTVENVANSYINDIWSLSGLLNQ